MTDLRARLHRVALASGAAVLVSWPLAGFTATAEKGPSFPLDPAIRIGLVVLGLGTCWAYALRIRALGPGGLLKWGAAAVRSPGWVGQAFWGLFVALLAIGLVLATVPWIGSGRFRLLLGALTCILLCLTMGLPGLLVLQNTLLMGIVAGASALLDGDGRAAVEAFRSTFPVAAVLGTVYAVGLAAWAILAPKVPPRLKEGPELRWGSLAVLLAFMVALPSFASRTWTSNLVEALVFATIALGLNITMGMAGLLVLGHAAFWAVGAYTFTLLAVQCGWNFWLAFPAAGAAAAITGLLLGLPALRLRGDYLAIVTLGFGEAIRWVLKNESGITGGDAGIPGSEVPGDVRAVHGPAWLWQPRTTNDCYWFALGLLVLCVTCVTVLSRSRFGRALFALREDETAAKCMGIDTVRVKLIAFTASAFWAGLAGVVHPIFRGQITPDLFDFNASVLFVAMVVLGGLGSIPGSIAGAAILFLLPQLLRDKFPAIQEYRMLIFGAVMAAMMVVKPEGIFGRAGKAGEDGAGEEGGPEGSAAPAAGAVR